MIRAVISAFIGYVVTAICVMAGIAVVCYSLHNAFAFSGATTMVQPDAISAFVQFLSRRTVA